jgi:hypothetical protein
MTLRVDQNGTDLWGHAIHFIKAHHLITSCCCESARHCSVHCVDCFAGDQRQIAGKTVCNSKTQTTRLSSKSYMLGSRATFGMSGLLAVVPTHPVVLAMPKSEEVEPASIEQQWFQKDVIVNNILQFVGAGQWAFAVVNKKIGSMYEVLLKKTPRENLMQDLQHHLC